MTQLLARHLKSYRPEQYSDLQGTSKDSHGVEQSQECVAVFERDHWRLELMSSVRRQEPWVIRLSLVQTGHPTTVCSPGLLQACNSR